MVFGAISAPGRTTVCARPLVQVEQKPRFEHEPAPTQNPHTEEMTVVQITQKSKQSTVTHNHVQVKYTCELECANGHSVLLHIDTTDMCGQCSSFQEVSFLKSI